MRHRLSRFLGVPAAIVMMVAQLLPAHAAEPGVNLVLSPASQSVNLGNTFDVVLQAEAGAIALNAVEIYMSFDKNKLAVVDADTVQAGTQLTAGSNLPNVMLNAADNSAGTIDYHAGALITNPTGTFTIATIRFQAVAATGSPTPVTFGTTGSRQTFLFSGSAQDVTGTLNGGSYTVTEVDTTPPTVAVTTPSTTTGVAVNSNIVFTFSEMMLDAAKNAFSIVPPVAGSLDWDALHGVLTFDPTSDLQFNTQYTVTIAATAADMAGNAMAAQYQFSFTTALQPPAVLTVGSSNIGNNTATVTGNLTTIGSVSPVNVRFEYGPTDSPYPLDTTEVPVSVTGQFSANLTGLTQGTLYHFRAKARSDAGTVVGTDMTFTTTAPPTVTTNAATNVISVAATLNGDLTSLGVGPSASPVTVNFEYGIGTAFNLSTPLQTNKTATGTFSANITGLTSDQTYQYRAKATNAYGTVVSSNVVTFTPNSEAPTVTTTSPATNIAVTSATVAGNLSALGTWTIAALSFEYGTVASGQFGSSQAADPSALNVAGDFTANLTGLLAGTQYQVKAKAVGSGAKGIGATAYGDPVTFTTLTAPTITTTAAANITTTTATLNGSATKGSAASVTLFFDYGSSTSYSNIGVAASPSTLSSDGTFSLDVTSLTPGVTYHFRARGVAGAPFAEAVGGDLTFTTPKAPSVTTTDATNLTALTARLNANLTSVGVGPNATPVTAYFEYSLSDTFTPLVKTPDQSLSATGVFYADISGLTQDTTHYARAVASNAWGSVTGNVVTFVPATVAPNVTTTTPATNITVNSATIGGSLSNMGTWVNAAVTFEYGTTTGYGQTATGTPASLTAPGSFTANLTGLTPGTLYHFRAKVVGSTAKAAADTNYGEDRTFTTLTLPAVSTAAATAILPTTATLNGTLSSKGTAASVAVFFDYGEDTNYGTSLPAVPPTLNATGSFSLPITGLVSGHTYHFRARAEGGAGYAAVLGNDAQFTAGTVPPTVASAAATSITYNSATLNGNLNNIGAGLSTTVALSFDWGTDTSYTGGNVVGVPASLQAPGAFTAALSGLTPSTTYHFRAKAVGNGNTSYGADTTFTTETIIQSITVTPASDSVALGRTRAFVATANLSDGTSPDITATATWASSNTDVAFFETTPGLAKTGGAGKTTGSAEVRASKLDPATNQTVTSAPATLTVTDKVVDSLAITPPTASIYKGLTQQFTVTPTYSDGSNTPVPTFDWSTSDGSKVGISGTGLATAFNVTDTGVTITATLNLTIQVSALVTVQPPTILSIAVTPNPAPASVALGLSKQFAATATYTDGSTGNITNTATWTSSPTTVADMSATTKGLATTMGKTTGQTTITASAPGVNVSPTNVVTDTTIYGTGTLDVTPKEMVSLSLSPAPTITVPKGVKPQFTATVKFTDDSTQVKTNQVTWTSSNTGKATISATGEVTTLDVGQTFISASIVDTQPDPDKTITSAPTKLVIDVPVLESITVSPANPSIPLGRTQQFTATGNYSDSTTAILTGVAGWTSSDTDVAVLSPATAGLATTMGKTTGTSTLTAAFGGRSGSTLLTVTAAVPDVIGITPVNPTIVKGKTIQFAASIMMSDGTTQTPQSIDWRSSDDTKVSVDANGLATALNVTAVNVPVTITAKYSGLPDCTTTVTVMPPVIESLTITPSPATGAAGVPVTLTLTGTYSDGTTPNVAGSATWSSANRAIATVSSTGIVTGVAVGSTRISAVKDGLRAEVTFNVTAAVLVDFTVTPANPVVPVGGAVQFTATPNYSNGAHAPIVPITWSSNKTNVTVTAGGGATAVTLTDPGQPAIISATATGGTATGSTTMAVTDATLVSIAVTPANASVAKGKTQQFTATGTYTDSATNGTKDITALVTWASANAAVGINSSGTATGVSVTTAPVNVTATLSGQTGTATMSVTAAALESIAISPASASVAAGRTKAFKATGTYSDKSTTDITSMATWSTSNPAKVTVSGGVATGVAVGSANIKASLDGKDSPNASVTVTRAELVTIAVTTGDASVAAGETTNFTATGTYSDNSTAPLTNSVQWNSSANGIASIDAAGLAKGSAAGTANITAGKDGITSNAVELAVTDAIVTAVNVTPVNPTIALGRTQEFRAMATYSDGSNREVTSTAAWTSGTETTATISAGGLATSVAAGATNITAAFGGVTSAASVLTVTAATLASIVIDQAGPPAPSVAAGKQQQFTVTGTYTSGPPVVMTGSVTWSSSSANIAKINAAGLAQTFAPGNTDIIATFKGTGGNPDIVSPAVVLTVTDPVLESITVTPRDPTITFDSGAAPTLQFTATGNRSDGSTLDLTATATWTSGTPATATINATGLAATVAAGTTDITATYNDGNGPVTSAASTLTVLPDRVAPVVTLRSPTEGMVLRDKLLTIAGSVDDKTATTVAVLNGVQTALALDGSGNFSQGVLLNAGNNTVVVRATDGVGNTASSGTRNVVVNPDKPAIRITLPADGLFTNVAVTTVRGTVTGASSVTLRVNGVATVLTPTPPTPVPASWTFSSTQTLVEGKNIIAASAYATGHETPPDADYFGTSGTVEVTLDITAPVVTVASPAANSVYSTPGITVNGTVDDPSVIMALLLINSGMPQVVPVVDGSFTQNITLVPGLNTLVVVTTDRVGNTSSSGVLPVTLDNTKPGVTVTAPAHNSMTNVSSQTVTGSTDELFGTATLTLNGGAPQPITVAPDGSFNQAVVLSAGLNTIEVKVVDDAVPPNEGTSGVIKVTLDATAPVLTIGLSDPTESITIMVSSDERLVAIPVVTVSGTQTGGTPVPATPVTMTRVEMNRWVGTYGSETSAILAGDYIITVAGTDRAGNNTTKTATFSKEKISVNGVDPTTVSNSNTTLNVETNGEVNNADITVTQHVENPSGLVENPDDAETSIGAFVEINASNELRDNLNQIYIRVDYDEADLPAGTDEDSLKLYLWDVTQGIWAAVPGSGVNVDENYIYGTVDHLSKYGVFGSPVVVTPPPPPAPGPVGGGGGGGGGGGAPPVASVVTSGLSGSVSVNRTTGVVQADAKLNTTDGKVTLDIPKNTKMLDAAGAALISLTSGKPEKPAAAPPQKSILANVEFGPNGATFDPPITLTMTYDPKALPAGVAEKDLMLSFFDGTKWVNLPSTVNTTDKTVSAKTSHFTEFAIIGTLPAPAKFTLATLSVSPASVKPGEPVTITANLTNSGGVSGKTTVVLNVNGKEEARHEITLNAGASQPVSFTVKKAEAATYTVELGGLTGSFTVTAPPPTTTKPAPPIPTTTVAPPPTTPADVAPPSGGAGPLVFIIIGGFLLLGLAAFIISKRKTKAA